MLKANQLHVSYGRVKVLDGISLGVAQGELVTLLGPNGAGKSTLVKTLSGLLRPHGGTIEFDGRRIDGMEADAIARLGLSQCPEGRSLFIDLIVADNLKLGAYIFKKDGNKVKSRLERIYELFPILRERAKQKAGTMSGGQQQMLVIGRALMAEPKLLILDEPSLGLAPLIIDKLFETIRTIHEEGITVLLVEQNAIKSLGIADRGYVLESGKVVLSGSKSELYGNEDVRRAYLGI
ncbi:MAG: ABC transporter ATP-binding protein [Deltaproteobacteria bacterium RBG_16_50_11]|nr:MAG: ABC transporter ATP-binding protein [Deltaproteobacteria bacterium RBG_16_50_11]